MDSALLPAPAELSMLLAAPADPEVRAALRRGLARLAAVDAPHLAPLRRVSEHPDGFRLTYAVAADASTWADLTTHRPPTTAETAALGLALCQALGALHSAGLAHGAVTADRVLISAGGTIELTGAGAAWALRDAAVAPPAADDVAALAELLETGLAPGSVGSDLGLLLVRAADPDPAVRPRVAELGVALERQCSPQPVVPEAFLSVPAPVVPPPAPAELVGSAPVGRAVPGDRVRSLLAPAEPTAAGARTRAPARLRPLLLAAAGLAGVLLLVQGLAGLLGRGAPAARTDEVAPTAAAVAPAPTPVVGGPAVADWVAVVRGLDAARVRALAAASATDLAAVVDPDGPAYARDLATMTARRSAGLRVRGGGLVVRAAVPVAVDDEAVQLEVTDTRAPYQLLTGRGEQVLEVPARAATTWTVTLSRAGPGWRVYDATVRDSSG